MPVTPDITLVPCRWIGTTMIGGLPAEGKLYVSLTKSPMLDPGESTDPAILLLGGDEQQFDIVPTIVEVDGVEGEYGVAEFDLGANDDPDFTGGPFKYRIREELTLGGGRIYEVDVPAATVGTLDLSEASATVVGTAPSVNRAAVGTDVETRQSRAAIKRNMVRAVDAADSAETDAAAAAASAASIDAPTLVRKGGEIVRYYDEFSGATNLDKIHNALDETTIAGGKLLLPDGVIDVGDGLAGAGYRCWIEGRGADYTTSSGGSALGTVFRATTQNGPVIDWTGFTFPAGYRGAGRIGGFAVEGSGLADPSGLNCGMKYDGGGAGTVTWFDIAITKTGGPCFDIDTMHFHDLHHIVCVAPIDAEPNNIPYFVARASNGNNMSVILYGRTLPDDAPSVGVDGAFALLSSSGNHVNVRMENLLMPDLGTAFWLAGISNSINVRQYDSYGEPGFTDVSMMRVTPPPTGSDYGANEIYGQIHGDNNGSGLTCGIDMRQSGNLVFGPKDYKGANVRIADGVTGNGVILLGRRHTADDPAFIDDAGDPITPGAYNGNTLLDYVNHPGTGSPGGPLPPVRKAADTTRNNNGTASADPHLTAHVEPGTYQFRLDLFYSSATTADLLGGFTSPSGSTLLWTPNAPQSASAGGGNTALSRSTQTGAGNLVFGGTGGITYAGVVGDIVVTTAGDLVFKWAQNSAEVSDTIVKAGSTLTLTQIA